MSDDWTYLEPDALISELRHGRMVLLLLDNSAGTETGIVTLAAELCEAEHVTFMARQARGLVCLGLTRSRCDFLNLPMMVEGRTDSAPFTLSIEAAEGIETGISAADRARTVRVAVAPEAVAADLVQPGHIFPIAAADGGLLTRADRAEATTDLARMAGLFPAAVFTDVLDHEGNMAEGAALRAFAEKHQLPVGRVSDLVDYRLANERTVDRIRSGVISTAHGDLQLHAYRDVNTGQIHLALTHGVFDPELPTKVRVHVTSILRDLVGTTLEDRVSWRFEQSLAEIASAERGALVLIDRPETPGDLLAGIDRLLGNPPTETGEQTSSYASIGLGAQILNDLGIGKIELLGAPLKYNALSGFGLEVVDFIAASD